MPATTRGRRRAAPAAPITPPALETDKLRELLATLEGHGAVLMTNNGRKVDIPPSAIAALTGALEYLANGEPVLICPADAELTTGEAATILSYSRQYVVRLLDEGAIPYRREGTHRRVLLRDVIRYREKRRAEELDALADILRISQEIGGFEETEADLADFSREAASATDA
jgi:excisionase family DNA binding protein